MLEGANGPRPVAVKMSWVSCLDNGPSEAENLRKIADAGVPNVSEIVGQKVLANLADDPFRKRFFAKFKPEGLHPEADNRYLHLKVMNKLATPLSRVTSLSSFLLAISSMLKGAFHVLLGSRDLLTDLDTGMISLAHRALSEAGFLHGNICPENLTVDRQDHTKGILVGFTHAIELAKPSRPRLMSVGLHGVAMDLLRGMAQPSYQLELESFFWSINHIVQNNRRNVPIATLATARWHQRRLVDMQKEKELYLDDFVKAHEAQFMSFSASLGAHHAGLFDFITKWADALVIARATHCAPPTYRDVISWLEDAIGFYNA